MGYARDDFDEDDDVADSDHARAEQEAFHAFVAMGDHTIEPFTLGEAVDVADDELANRYGPMWRTAVFALFPTSWSYEWDDDNDFRWQVVQAVVLVRGDLAAAGRSRGLTAVVVRALAEALEVWGRSDLASHEAILAALDDVNEALRRIPIRRLWEAGLVPVKTTTYTEVVAVPPGRPWIPDDFRPLADADSRPTMPDPATRTDGRTGQTTGRG